MAAVTLADLMAGLETRLRSIDGLRVDDISPGQVNPPQAVVGVPAIPSYWTSFGRGSWRPNPTITVFTSAAFDRPGQLALASYADVTGTNSIPLAIEADRTLGLGAGVDCIVTDFRPLGLEEVNQLGYFGGVFTLQVIARGV
jgi:hypothetical protein